MLLSDDEGYDSNPSKSKENKGKAIYNSFQPQIGNFNCLTTQDVQMP